MEIKPKAFLFDLNGTMIDDMLYHNRAWHDILNNELGKSMSFEEVKLQMYGKNSELLDRVFGKGHFTPEEADKISMEKERRYQQAYLPHLKLIGGLDTFLSKAKEKNVRMAICSAAINFNISFVVDNLKIREYFNCIVSADDVEVSKPHPETFLKAALALNINPAECIVFEDAPKGVEAAKNAGMACVVLKTLHHEADFSQYDNVFGFINDYNDPLLNKLLPIHQTA